MDRLDYTKGIYARLRAYAELIDDGQIDVEDAVFVQVAVTPRERVGPYQEVRDDIERWVGRINGDLSRIGRLPIHYLHSSYSKKRDGRLVPGRRHHGGHAVRRRDEPGGEGVCDLPLFQNTGALVLSEFAGAPDELKQAFLVNPHDINGLKDTMWAAIQAPRDGPEPADARDAQDRQAATTSPPGRTAS